MMCDLPYFSTYLYSHFMYIVFRHFYAAIHLANLVFASGKDLCTDLVPVSVLVSRASVKLHVLDARGERNRAAFSPTRPGTRGKKG